MGSSNLADQLLEVLLEARVERIYGVVGDSLNPVVDALRRTDGIEWVHVRNEEAAAFAAAAEAQLTGRLAVCAGSCGPGNTHLIQGLYDAHRSGAPVLALAAHIPSRQIGTGFFQETHPERLFTECSDYCEMVSAAGADAAGAADSACNTRWATGASRCSSCRRTSRTHRPPNRQAERPGGQVRARRSAGRQMQALAEKLNDARKVMLFCGAGVRDAHAEVMALADRVAAPVGHSLRGKEWIQFDNAFDVG